MTASSDDALRRSFDGIADLYAKNFADELDRKPYDRDLLDGFAATAEDPVADLGSGPGHVGAYLARRGKRVVACDFSAESLRQGRSLFPDLGFVAGDLRSLPFGDASLGGAVAFYSLIYGDEDHLLDCLREISRVLQGGGWTLVAVHGGTGADHFDDYQGRPIDVTIVGRDPDRLRALAGEAGLQVEEVFVRDPYEFEHPTQRIYLLATR